jgi:nitrite reductase (NADH) small subunit
MTTAEWLDIGWVDQIPVRGSRTVQVTLGKAEQ